MKEEDELNQDQAVQSRWRRFVKCVQQPFRLDQSLKNNDPDYYTAIYSSNIDKFEKLFDNLRGGSRKFYFTPTERSLLTHELLSRAHFDYEPIDGTPDLNDPQHVASSSLHLNQPRHPHRIFSLLGIDTAAQDKQNNRRPGNSICRRGVFVQNSDFSS